MGKKHPYYGKSMSINFPDFPYIMGFVAFSRTVGNLWGNPCIFHMLKYTIGWELGGQKHQRHGKSMIIVWLSISQTFPIPWVLFNFPVLWEIYRETHAFPICYFPSIPYDGNLMGKKHPYYGKSMSINFPDFSHTMGFAAFSRTVENLRGNPSIYRMMTSVNFFLWCFLTYFYFVWKGTLRPFAFFEFCNFVLFILSIIFLPLLLVHILIISLYFFNIFVRF